MGLLHIKCLIFLLGATEIVGTACDPPPSSTATTNIVGTAHEGRASVSAGESFSYTCTTRQNIEWQPICPNSVYPPNVLEEYTITCLGDNQWDYVSEGCCPTESELDYVGCFLTTADISYDYPYYYPAHIGKVCQKLGLKYAFVDDGHGATGCLSSDQFLSLDIVDAPDSCTVFRKASMTWMGDSSTADANGEDIFSIFESFYGCYEISDTSWFVDNAQYKKTGWSSMKEGDCNSFCLRMFGDKKVYTVAYNTNECYCVDSDTPHTTAAREGNGIKLQWSDCQEPCAGDGSFTSTGCGSSTHAVVQHTDAAIAYGKDENCFSLFLDHNIADHGYYKFQEGVRYCSFYDGTYCDEGWIGFNGNCYVLISGYSTTSYDDAEFKCADDYDGHLISILDSGDGDYWMTNFLKIFAEHTGISSNTDIWVGGFNPYAGGGQNFMWNDGTILFEYPENHDFEDWTGQCLYLTVTNNNAGITVKSGDCTSTATRQVMCQRPSNTRDGVRSYGCWEKHDSITSVEGSHADLPTYPPALQKVQPWVTCESVISELESNPTMFGISEGECYGNSGSGHFYMAGATSTQCKGGYGSELSYDIYESEAIPQGYIGCYDVISTGNEQKTSDDMTVTGCREICYALKTTLYKYKYAALKGTECHCFEDFPARNGGTRYKLSSCDSFCPGNSKQRCGNTAGTTYSVYSAVKYYPFVRSCRDAAFNLLPVEQFYRRSTIDFWDSGIEGKIKRTRCTADDMKVDAGCPDKTWFGTDGQCVKLSLAQLPRVESQAICRTLGGDLYRPTNSEELDEVFIIKADIYSAVGGDTSYRLGAAHAQTSVLDILWADGGWPDSLVRPIYDPYDLTGLGDEINGEWKNPYNDDWNNLCMKNQKRKMVNCEEDKSYKFFCSLPKSGSEVFVGCYSESANQVSTTASPVTQSQQMHVTGCRQICLNAEIQYAMLTGEYCRCVSSLTGLTSVSRDNFCGDACPGMHLQDCGKVSTGSSSVYATGAADPPTSCSWYQAGGLLTSGQYLIDPDLSGDTVQYRTQCNSYDNSADCDFANGWVSYKEHCYFLSTDKKTYDEAYNTCVDGDGLLLSASKGFDEIEFIEKLIRADSAFSLSDLFYVGLYQLDADTFPSTTDYVYLDSGIITDDNNLHDDWEDQGNPPCFAWRSSDMTQFPVLCNETHRYICRKDPPGEMMCTSKVTSDPGYTVTNHRMSNTLCRLVCQGKQYDFAATNFETCSCFNKSALESHSALSLSQCDIPCPTIKYQRCGGSGDKMLVTHSHPECPANAGFTSGENCYLALEINVNFWEAAEQCSLLYGNNVGLSDSNCTECQNLVTELGKELWINPYRQTVPGTDFYSAPLLSYLSEWSDSTLDLDTDPGRCSVLTSSGRRLADCEGESLGAFCYKLKAPTTKQASSLTSPRNYGIGEYFTLFYGSSGSYDKQGVQDLETYCREGSAWFADFAGNCYTYVPVTSTAEFLTACRDIGAPRAVINTREDDDWLLSFRSQSRPLSTLYDNQRAITGTFDLDGNGNLISMDGTYWSGQFHNLRSDSYLSAYVRNLWEDLDDSLMHGPYINNKEDGSDLFVAEFASNMQGVLCERSRAYHGCYSIAGESLFKVYEVDYQPNTVYQCVESCRALEYSLIAITGASCYCSNDILGTYQTDQAACMGRCANTNLAVDLCGSSTLSTAIYINISDPIYDLLASTCTDLHNEGAVLSGTYKLSLSSTIDNFYCHSGGEEYGLALTRVSSVTISASSESTDYPASNARIYGLSTWVASSDTDQWWQVVFDTPHIITAILSQGNGIETGTVELFYGSFAGSFTLEFGMDASDPTSWLSYNGGYMLKGAESRGELVKTHLNNPPIATALRLYFPSYYNGYDIAGRFEVVGFPYSTLNNAHPTATTYTGHTYYISFNTMSYTEAQNFCSDTMVGGYLAVPDSQEEYDIILSLNLDPVHAWIGISDRVVEGAYRTPSGSSILFTKWASNHPVSSEAEDCVRVNTDGEWEVVDCSAEPYLALCEVDYPQPSPGAQSYMGCYLDVSTDESLFYPAKLSTTVEECTEACHESGHMFASFNLVGTSTVDTPFYFSESVDEAYVTLLPALDTLTELTICLYYLMDGTSQDKDRCLLGSDTTSFRLCKRGDNSDEYFYYNSQTGASHRFHQSAEGWVPVCLVSATDKVLIYVGDSSSNTEFAQTVSTTTLDSGSKIILGQGSTNDYVGDTDTSTERFYGSIRRVNVWDTALNNLNVTEYMNGQIFGNKVSSDDSANWLAQLEMSTNVRIQSIPPIIPSLDFSQVTVTASSEDNDAKATDFRITDERVNSGGSSGGGWCADVSDGTDETWKIEFGSSYTVYSIVLMPRSQFYSGGQSGHITSVEVEHSSGICIGEFPTCTVFEVTADDYTVMLPYPVTTNDISLRIKSHDGKPCARFEFYGLPAPNGNVEVPADSQWYGGHAYVLDSTQTMTYFEAVDYCADALPDGYVTVPDTEDEATFIKNLKNDVSYGMEAWIGLTDYETEGVFADRNGDVPPYEDWYPGQPNNYKVDQKCTVFYTYDQWNDDDCTDSYYVICESDMVLPLAEISTNCSCSDTLGARINESYCDSTAADSSSEAYRPVHRAWRSHCKPYGDIAGVNVTGSYNVPELIPDIPSVHYLGCWKSKDSNLMSTHSTSSSSNSPSSCRDTCFSEEFKYATLRDGQVCECTNSYQEGGRSAESSCDVPCPGDASYMCGGSERYSVYTTGFYGVSVTSLLEPQIPGTRFELSCVAGYQTIVKDGNDITECDIANRKWTTEGFYCRPAECSPTAQNIVNGSAVMAGHTYLETVIYSCIEGHYFSDNTSSRTSVCQADETWTITQDQSCQPVDCLDPPVADNSNSVIPSTLFNFTVTYECEEGYAFNPDFVQDNEASQTTMEITCSANGAWLPDVTHCLPVYCPSPPMMGKASREVYGQYYSNNATYKCDTGYSTTPTAALTGAEILTQHESFCQPNGTWSPVPSDCLIIECPTPTSVVDTTVVYNNTEYNSTALYKCDTGTAMNPFAASQVPRENYTIYQQLTCVENGSWVPEIIPCQTIECAVPAPAAFTTQTVASRDYQSTATYDCITGYALNANATWFQPPQSYQTVQTTECSAAGEWAPVDNCSIILCPPLDPLPFSLPDTNNTEYGTTVNFVCLYGYKQEESLPLSAFSATCQDDGLWDQTVTDCIVNQCLDEPTPVPNAQINIISRVFEEVPANISCDFGYEYSDGTESQLINCTSDDQGTLVWAEPEYAACQRVECVLPELNCTKNIEKNSTITSTSYYYEDVVILTSKNSKVYAAQFGDGDITRSGEITIKCLHREWSATFINCTEKFVVPPGAYVRNADYYWSFNEYVDSGSIQIFQNTGEYSFGLFNASASFIEQRNDSILNGSTWYTVKFDKIRKQCITIPGFIGNYSCIVNPATCEKGLSMEVWVKLQTSDLISEETQVIASAGNSDDGGTGGFTISLLGKKLTLLIATSDEFWKVEKNLPSVVVADEWFNLGFRWEKTGGIGLQAFINGELLEEIPYSSPSPSIEMPADNKLYVGCRKLGFSSSLQDYLDVELDELAFWGKYLKDKQLLWLTGAIIPAEDIEKTIFPYNTDLELLVAPPSDESGGNPYYEIADIYTPVDRLNFDDAEVVNITRGSKVGLLLNELVADPLELSETLDEGVSDLRQTDEVSFSFWIYPDVEASHPDGMILEAVSWDIQLIEGNITFTGQYSVDGAIKQEMYSVAVSLGIWSNFGFTFRKSTGFDIYVNGIKRSADAEYTEGTGSDPGSPVDDVIKLRRWGGANNVTVNDLVIWKRYLYSFESYRFLGMSPSEAYLDSHADFYWSTDYYTTTDKAAMNTSLPIYKTVDSTVQSVVVADGEIPGQTNKGQAMKVTDDNGWLMLALEPFSGSTTTYTGSEFAGTCLSDPSKCENGLTVALWLKLSTIPTNDNIYYILTSGEEDSMSRGFSINLHHQDLCVALVDGEKYWKVCMASDKYSADGWMHLAFTWKSDEGLWVFLDGDLVAANKEGVAHSRPTDRYNRITLGRNNANNVFGGFLSFYFQEVAVYLHFSVTYRIRELFALSANYHYSQADYYYSKESLVTSSLSSLQSASGRTPFVGPHGKVDAENKTIALGEGARLVLEHFDSANTCVMIPSECSSGLTVATWARNNLFLEEGDLPIFIVSSHAKPEKVINGSAEGWTIYYTEQTFMVTLVSGTKQYSMTISELAKPLLPQRWTNIGFTWSESVGMTLLMDGQVANILKAADAATVSPDPFTDSSDYYLMAGHEDNKNNTFIGIYNLVIFENYYFGSKAYELTGHTVDVISKYSTVDLMWTFDGPIHDFNNKYDEMVLRMETYDSSLIGAALQVTRDGLHNASLGNYSSECVTQPSSCKAGFQLSLQLKLSYYTPGEAGDDIGSILMLGSPDANFEGVAVQQLIEDGEDKIVALVVNDKYTWRRAVTAVIGEWFDLVIGWNIQDGIAMKINNKKVSGSQTKTLLPIGSSKLVTNHLIMGVGTGGGTNQGVDAVYNDISLTYNSKVTVEQEGRCYDTASLYYRLNKGQIFTMENEQYVKDRESISESAFKLAGDGYVELDYFVDHCFSDPSRCNNGLSVSLYVKLLASTSESQTLLSSGAAKDSGYSITVKSTSAGDDGEPKAEVKVVVSNGDSQWEVVGDILLNTWTNIGFTWNNSDLGLSLFVDGVHVETDTQSSNSKSDTQRFNLVIGRGNSDDAEDFSNAEFDDIGVWDSDLRAKQVTEPEEDEPLYEVVGIILQGKQCNTEDELLVEAEEPQVVETTLDSLSIVTLQPPNCQFYDESTNYCAETFEEFHADLTNDNANETFKFKLNKIPSILEEISKEVAQHMPNTSNSEDDLRQQLELFESVKYFEVDDVIDPREADLSIQHLVTVVNDLLDADTWKDAWDTIDDNSTRGPVALMTDLEELAMKITKNLYIGLDKEDDCSNFKSGAENLLMSCQKRRLKLCDSEFIFPEYDKLSADPSLNSTLEKWKRPTDNVYMPASLFPKHEYPDDAVVSVAVFLYEEASSVIPSRLDVSTFINLEATTSADNPEAAVDPDKVEQSTVNSRIMSILVDPQVPAPLDECIIITLEHKQANKDNKRTSYCAFWDFKLAGMLGGGWSSDGCEVAETNETHTVCCCYHMTSFAIMMEPEEEEVHDSLPQTISMIMYVCNGLSIVSLLLLCLIILCSKALRSERYMVHLNLSIAMIFAHGSYLLVDFAEEASVMCKVAAIAQHYFFVVSYAWVLMEALWLFYAVTNGTLMGKMKYYVFFGWVVPAGIVILCVSMYLNKYGLNEKCWLTYNDYLIFAMLVPILFCLFLNASALLIIVCNLPQPTLKREDILSEVRWAVFFAMLLVPILFFIWLLALMDVLKINTSDTVMLVYTAIFSLQGFLMFLVYGVGQRSVRMAVMRRKYQPEYPSSALLSHRGNSPASSTEISRADSAYVEVKPQPMSRPTSRSSKEKSDNSSDRTQTPVTALHSRPSSAESEGGYIS